MLTITKVHTHCQSRPARADLTDTGTHNAHYNYSTRTPTAEVDQPELI